MTQKPKYYACAICDHNHPWDWNGDCRDDANRFTDEQLDAKHGSAGYELADMTARVEADSFIPPPHLPPNVTGMEAVRLGAFKVGDRAQTRTQFAGGKDIPYPKSVGRVEKIECGLAILRMGPVAIYVRRCKLEVPDELSHG